MNPTVSVIMPLYNVENYVRESLDNVLQQTFPDFEIICVDDCSDDNTVSIVEEYVQKDSRIRLIRQESNKGAGAARNIGFLYASGKYTIFLDGDDLFSEELLEKTVAEAEETDADIVAFNFSRFDEEGNSEERKGIHTDWLPKDIRTFNYKDCPDRIMSVVNPTPWNKLYRTDFIREHDLRFEEISSNNDITFAAVSVAAADQVAFLTDSLVEYRIGHSGSISSTKKMEGKNRNVKRAVLSAVEQVQAFPVYPEIKNAACRFAADNLLFALNNYVDDIDNAEEFYSFIHEYFNSDLFDSWTREACGYELLWLRFQTVKAVPYEEYRSRIKANVVVSITSFPARIEGVPMVLETIYSQTRVPDRVVLWLGEEQFPGKEADLPEELTAFSEEGKLEIRWCDDLKPHKKYFYMMQEVTDGVVITIDDDIQYPPEMVESLCLSYVRFPNAVSTARGHIIATNGKDILPYKYWLSETDIWIGKPSMQFVATGAAGVLYPAGIFKEKKLFDREMIMELCPIADDLWLKAMELVSDVPVVLASSHRHLHYVPGSQDSALYHMNIEQDANDRQLENIIRQIDSLYGEGFFLSKILDDSKYSGLNMVCNDEIWKHVTEFTIERERQKKELQEKLRTTYTQKSEINARLQKAYADKSEINAKLQQTYAEKSEINAKLKQTYAEKSEINAKLKQTYAEKSEINSKLKQSYAEKTEINAKLRKAYADKTELNQKLQTAYKEKSDRGIKIKELEKSLAKANDELKRIKESIPYRVAAKVKRELRKIPFLKKG